MSRINVAQVIDRSRLHSLQILVLVLCGLCMIMDGFDVQAMGYVAPALIKEWQISKTALGPIFGAGLFGIMLGSLGLSIVADRIGRRPVRFHMRIGFSAPSSTKSASGLWVIVPPDASLEYVNVLLLPMTRSRGTPYIS